MKKKSFAVVYMRFSSEKQADGYSIEAQKEKIDEYAEKNYIEILEYFIDEAKKGSNDRREGFQKMKDYIEEEESLSYILCHKRDRVFRSKSLISNFELFLEDFDIELVAVNQIYQSRKEKIIMESTEDMLAEFYLANLAEETMKGLMISAKQCLYNGGKPPIGYDVGKDKKYIINEAEANIVRELFEEYSSGKSMDAFLKHCQQKGYLTKWGKPFGKNSFNSILKNEKYRGVYVWNRRESRNSHGRCNHHRNKSDDQIIRVEGGIPRIVSDELFFKVQERMKKNKESAGRFTAKHEYLFSSKIFCGKCGHAYTGNTRTSGKGIPYTGYRCGERCRTNACSNREIERTHLEKYVLEKLKNHLFTKDGMVQIAKQLNVFQKGKQRNGEADLKQAKQRLSNVDRKINNVTNAITQGMFNESMQSKMTE